MKVDSPFHCIITPDASLCFIVCHLLFFRIIQQFINNEFSESANPTNRPNRYRTSFVSNNRIIDVQISDFPALDKFPEDSLAEWNLHFYKSDVTPAASSFCRLRQASAYVLVFDAARPGPTFQYIRQIRDQILTYGSDMYKKPIVVAANKHDLLVLPRPHANARSRVAKTSSPSQEWGCIVRKQWRCCYVECSAKLNWQAS